MASRLPDSYGHWTYLASNSAMWVSPCHVSFIGWRLKSDLGNACHDTLDRSFMQIDADLQWSNFQNSTKFKRLTWPPELAPAIWVFLEGSTGPGGYLTGHGGSMLDADQCWSPRIKLPKFNQIQKTHMATWVSPCHMSFLGRFNRTRGILDRTWWINAWCRSMLIPKDQTSKIQPNSKDSHGHLS